MENSDIVPPLKALGLPDPAHASILHPALSNVYTRFCNSLCYAWTDKAITCDYSTCRVNSVRSSIETALLQAMLLRPNKTQQKSIRQAAGGFAKDNAAVSSYFDYAESREGQLPVRGRCKSKILFNTYCEGGGMVSWTASIVAWAFTAEWAVVLTFADSSSDPAYAFPLVCGFVSRIDLKRNVAALLSTLPEELCVPASALSSEVHKDSVLPDMNDLLRFCWARNDDDMSIGYGADVLGLPDYALSSLQKKYGGLCGTDFMEDLACVESTVTDELGLPYMSIGEMLKFFSIDETDGDLMGCLDKAIDLYRESE